MSIILNNVTYTYMKDTPYEHTAISGINLEINKGEFVGIIGHTGSGKSTLVQHLNGLLRPSSGMVAVDGQDIHIKGEKAKQAKRKVGMVFQYPEHQLFEETIAEDIAFGPRNMGISEDEIPKRVQRAMAFVGLDYDTFAGRSPFSLSGGQMRRVAIAGVIALEPEYLILDEPSAGLDPRGREEIFAQIYHLYQTTGIAVVLVSHNMEDVAKMADRLIVMQQGSICADDQPGRIFSEMQSVLQSAGVDVPPVVSLLNAVRRHGLDVDCHAFTPQQAAQNILNVLRRQSGVK